MPDDGCDAACALEAGFDCNGEPTVCTPVCGDGMVRGAEACDDGNLNAGDGCDEVCAIEAGYECKNEPSICCAPQPEVCDGVDNDCNGVADEGCNCIDGMTMACYTGPAGTEGVGLCIGGVQTCVNGNWGACLGEVVPTMEICDGLDQDCDGMTDDGVGCVCVPGSTKSCYTGPMGTQDVGQCKAGVETCAADGKSYGACLGQILPAPENCATPVDDDCNGTAPACTGAHLVSKGFGDAQAQQGLAITTDPGGNVIIAGAFTGSIDFGGGALTSQGGTDIFVAKFTPAGALVWAKAYGATGDQSASGVATDAQGNVFFTGTFQNAMSIGPFALTNGGADDIFVAKLAPGGNETWAYGFGVAFQQTSSGIAVDPSGNVVIAGSFSGTFSIGMSQLSGQGNLDAFVAKFANDGTALWAKGFGSAMNQQAFDVATDVFGNILFTGSMSNTADFGGGMLTSAGGDDLFVAKLGPMGNHLFSKRYGDVMDQRGLAIAADPGGNMLVTGQYAGAMDLGGGAYTSGGGADGFVVKLDAIGNHVWSKSFGQASAQRGKAIASDALGNVLLTGEFFGSINFGGAPVTAIAQSDIFVAKLSSTGTQVWLRRYGNAGNDRGEGVAVDAAGSSWFTGSFIGNVDFGGGIIDGGVADNVFLLGLAP